MKNLIIRVNSSKYLPWLLLAAIIIIFVTAKMIIAGQWFTHITVVDEALYINAARSLHNDGKLLFSEQPSTLIPILYPIVLSVAYFFYSPENIMTAMRLLGTIVYAAGFIPVYLLSRNILKSQMKALAVVVVTMFIPETNYALFMSQEITHFPLMMCAFYLMHLTATNDVGADLVSARINDVGADLVSARISSSILKGKSALYQILLGIVLCLLVESKNIGMAMLVSYVFYILAIEYCIFGRFKNILRTIVKLAYTVVPFILLLTAFSIAKEALREHSGLVMLPVIEDRSIYAPSFSIFLEQLQTDFFGFFLELVKGSMYYVFYFCIAILVLPVLIPLLGFRELEEKEKKLLLLAICATAFSILVVVFEVYPLGGGSAFYPQKVHLRFIYYMFVPFIILSVHLIGKKIRLNPGSCALILFLVAYIIYRRNLLGIGYGSTYDNMSLYLIFYHPSLTWVLVAIPVVIAGILLIKKHITLSKPLFYPALLVMLCCCLVNTWYHINFTAFESHDSNNHVSVAKLLADKDNVLQIAAPNNYDFMAYRLDAYFGNGHNIIGAEELLSYATSAETDGGKVSVIELEEIIPESFPYKSSVFPLGDVEYVIVYKGTPVVDAQLLDGSELSSIFDVYKINNNILKLAIN